MGNNIMNTMEIPNWDATPMFKTSYDNGLTSYASSFGPSINQIQSQLEEVWRTGKAFGTYDVRMLAGSFMIGLVPVAIALGGGLASKIAKKLEKAKGDYAGAFLSAITETIQELMSGKALMEGLGIKGGEKGVQDFMRTFQRGFKSVAAVKMPKMPGLKFPKFK